MPAALQSVSAPDAAVAPSVDNGEWTLLSEELLRGLVHSMNNAITTLSAFAELAGMGDEPLDVEQLRREVSRLHGVSTQAGLLATRTHDMSALEVQPLLEVAISLHAHHPRSRVGKCVVEQDGSVLPVRVHRWALLRLLVLVVDAAKRMAAKGNEPVARVRIAGDDVIVSVRAASDAALGADGTAFAAYCGGTVQYEDGEVVVRLPSLLEIRRREREAT